MKVCQPAALDTDDHAWWRTLYSKEWVVYAKRPFGGPAQVLKYLARYTHRVAISNNRLLEVCDGRVTFAYKDYADARGRKAMTLAAGEFLRRFVQHVLPRGFVKIRHYGLLANRATRGSAGVVPTLATGGDGDRGTGSDRRRRGERGTGAATLLPGLRW